MNIKYFDNFEGLWLDVTGSAGGTMQYDVATSGFVMVNTGKSIICNITQTGTSAPTLTTFVNTSGATLTTSYTSVGNYKITASTEIFDATNTWIMVSNSESHIEMYRNSSTEIIVKTYTPTGTFNNGLLIKKSFEIRLY
jgi:hypothetical protein